MEWTEELCEESLGALVELLAQSDDEELRDLADVLHDGRLSASIIGEDYNEQYYRVVLHAPASFKRTRPLADIEDDLLDLVKSVVLPDDGYVTVVRIRFQPSRKDWRRGAPRPAASELVGDRYRLVRRLGGGGFGEVYEAQEIFEGGPVAVKFLTERPDLSNEQNQQHFLRMAREIRTLIRLDHPNVIKVLNYGQDAAGRLWYALPLAEGSMKDRLAEISADEASALALLEDVAAGLDYLHENSVVHRDLTPGNILFLDGRWVLVDFGLIVNLERESELLTQTVMGVGTRGYYPPEVMHARSATPAWDVYSLGQNCLDLITGKTFDQRDGDPGPEHPFMPAIMRALSTDPRDRFPSASAFVAECRRLRALAVSSNWEGPADRMERWNRQLVDPAEMLAAFDEIVADIEAAPGLMTDLTPALRALSDDQIAGLFDHRPGAFRRFFDAVITESPYSSIPFEHLDHVARFLARCAALPDDYFPTQALRWIADNGFAWNRFNVQDVGHALVQQLGRDRPQVIRPAFEGLDADVVRWAVERMGNIPPDARPELPPAEEPF